MTEKQFILSELHRIILDITSELNDISPAVKKQIQNTVYYLGTNLNLESRETRENNSKMYAFIIKKSFWKNKMTLELRSADKLTSRIDDYRNYKNVETLDIFDIESLIAIKYFLLLFAE